MAIYNIHAGHNPANKIGCGAVGILNESIEDRSVKDDVINLLSALGHTVYDCTEDNGTSQNDVLSKIVKKCNAHNVDLDISIHFNSGRNDYVGNNVIGGVECYVYPNGGANNIAKCICDSIASLGFTNRGVKERKDLYVLNETRAMAILIEVCFVDDLDDSNLYSVLGHKKIAQAIVSGLLGQHDCSMWNAKAECPTYIVGKTYKMACKKGGYPKTSGHVVANRKKIYKKGTKVTVKAIKKCKSTLQIKTQDNLWVTAYNFNTEKICVK